MHLRIKCFLLIGIAPLVTSMAFSQVSDYTAEMDRRLRVIAGNNAFNCGAVLGDGERNPEPVLKCARRAIGNKLPFFVRSDSWGINSFLSDGLAGNGSGDVYYVEFDSQGWALRPGDPKEAANAAMLGELCPKPVRIRRIPWPDKQYVGLTCQRRKT